MRVVAGALRGRPLRGFKGRRIRPTSDRVKEAIFNVLASRGFFTSEPLVLDLFAGSGGLGIEALSRGAVEAVFVDVNPQATGLIKKNIESLGLADKALILCKEAGRAVKGMQRNGALFDIIFMDPPYESALIEATLEGSVSILAPGGIIAAEGPKGLSIEAAKSGLQLLDKRIYGDTAVFFLGR
ncbi:MAG: 16S rRNA (guanine(966)-N(2))-methyltransferase RsmD [Thermodesulfobacteriota bacterium]